MIRYADFQPAWWLPGPHAQTLWASTLRRKPNIRLRRERLELPDGDFLDLDWNHCNTGPITILLHGLEGSSRSNYIRGILQALQQQGWRAVVMHFRNCSEEPNRLARSYNAGETGDFDYLLNTLQQREPETPFTAVGYSLGGNALLKWLGEKGTAATLHAAVAVSVPFLLEKSAQRMKRGFSRLYQRYLLNNLFSSYRRKFQTMPEAAPVPEQALKRLNDFFLFDDVITAPLHGYAGVQDYYQRASSRQYLRNIAVPTMILHAQDDPFMSPQVIPDATELSTQVTLELSPSGGHVGFVSGTAPWRASYWLEQRIPAYFSNFIG